MKELHIEEIKVNDVTVAIRILRQSFIGNDFWNNMSNYFIHNNFVLVSEHSPDIMENQDLAKYNCRWGLYVRGAEKRLDYKIVRVPNGAWLVSLRHAVIEYNRVNHPEFISNPPSENIKITREVIK
jgi:hypothetical protein